MSDKERTQELVVVDISRYKKIKNALKDSEARYRLLFENMPLGVFRITADGKIVDANPALLKMLGYSSFSELEHRSNEKSSQNFLETWLELCNQIDRQSASGGFDLTWRKKDTTPLFIHVNARVIRENDDKVLIYEGTIEDITERKRAETQREAALEVLKKSSQLLKDTGEMAEVGGWELDLSTQEVSWTEEVCRIHGVEPGFNPKLEKAVNFFAPESRPVLEEAMKKAAETGEPYDLEFLFIPQGSKDKIWVRSIGRPVYSDGKIVKLAGTFQNIDKYKRAESQREAALEALRRTEENFRRSLDESPLGVRIVTAKGKTIYANRALLDLYGYANVDELNQTTLKKRYTPKSYNEYKTRRKTRSKGRLGPGEYEVSIIRKNGEIRHLQVFRKAILWNGAKQFQTLYRDISESKHWLETIRKFEKTIQGQKMLLDQQSSSVEELIGRLTQSREELGASYRELKAKKDDLVRSERLAFTGRMAAGIAHEIRNPLTNVILSVRQLKKTENLKPEIHKYAEIMERNANRIEYLISELLNCAHPVKLNLQSADIHLLIHDILNVHKVRLKTQKIKVVRNLTAHPSILLFDKEQLGRVFLNLITNAIDAMRKGGKLTIDTKSEKKKFLIKIHDNGSGISEKDLIKVFDPFFSTKKGGTGLGLSTCQNIVSSHGGLIEVESTWRKGSVFSVSLPFEAKLPYGKEKRERRS